MVAWEVTRSCNLACGHCRASALCGPYEGELGTEKCLRLLDEIAAVGKPVIILTGGEPLLRADIYEIAAYGNRLGLRMVLATNGTFVTEAVAKKLIEAGIRRVSISLDGPDAGSHDAFRCVPGAFAEALAGIEAMKKAGLEFQINTTITQANLAQIREIHDLAHRLGAAAHHIFLLVPTGRGKELADQAITPLAYEETLNWFYEEGLGCGIQLKATCAPHYYQDFPSKTEGAGRSGGKGGVRRCGNRETVRGAHRPSPQRHDPGLPRGERLLLHLPHGAGPTLRLSGARLRSGDREKFFGDLERFRNIPKPPRSRPLRREMRPLRIPPGLRRMPGAGLRGDRGLPGRGAAVHL